MKVLKRFGTFILVAVVSTLCLTGCPAFRASTSVVDPNQTTHYSEKFDRSDLKGVTGQLVQLILNAPVIAGSPTPPIMMIAEFENATTRHVDTKNLTDSVRTGTLNSGRVQYINASRRNELLKEQNYQAINVDPNQKVAIGRQAGAKYMLSGRLTEMTASSVRQVRISKTKESYYKLTAEITDLETGLITWSKEIEFARATSYPLIGW